MLDFDAFLEAVGQLNEHLGYKEKVRRKVSKLQEMMSTVTVRAGGERWGAIQEQFLVAQRQFDEISLLCNILVLNLALDEVERFKIEKYKHYCQAFKTFCTESLRDLHETRGLFKFMTDFVRFNA